MAKLVKFNHDPGIHDPASDPGNYDPVSRIALCENYFNVLCSIRAALGYFFSVQS